MSSVRYNGSDRFSIFNSGRDISFLHNQRPIAIIEGTSFDRILGMGEERPGPKSDSPEVLKPTKMMDRMSARDAMN